MSRLKARNPGSITIRDVAKQANVSVATVSRTLNGMQHVAEEVRQRVMAAVQALHYVPHHAARSLSSRRTQTIGVVLPDLHGEFFSELIRGVDQGARQHGYHLLVSSHHGQADEQRLALQRLPGRVDGALVMAPCGDQEGRPADLPAGLPVVLINAGRQPGTVPALNVDNHGGALSMTQHLIGAGHRRIAFICGPQDSFDARERLCGYRDAMLAAGLAPWVVEGSFDEASGYRAGQQLANGPLPDAVFAANDMMALGCLFAFNHTGIAVPEQIALAGFDDVPMARYVHPALTTMRVDIAGLGLQALQYLLQHIAPASDALPTAPSLPGPIPELIVRASSTSRSPTEA